MVSHDPHARAGLTTVLVVGIVLLAVEPARRNRALSLTTLENSVVTAAKGWRQR